MGNLYKINVVDNEVVKAADIQNGNQSTRARKEFSNWW